MLSALDSQSGDFEHSSPMLRRTLLTPKTHARACGFKTGMVLIRIVKMHLDFPSQPPLRGVRGGSVLKSSSLADLSLVLMPMSGSP